MQQLAVQLEDRAGGGHHVQTAVLGWMQHLGHIAQGRADALHPGREALGRAGTDGRMQLAVVLGAQPVGKLLIECIDVRTAGNRRQKLLTYAPEKPLDFSFALGLIGPGVHQGDAQRGRDMLKVPGAIRRPVVHVQLARKTPF